MEAYFVPTISISKRVLHKSFDCVISFHSMAGFLSLLASCCSVNIFINIFSEFSGIGLFFANIFIGPVHFFQRKNILGEFKIRI